MTKILIIIRGVPGAGKTTVANALVEWWYSHGKIPDHFEADQFFTDKNGGYHYQSHLVPAAHEWCRRKVRQSMQVGCELIVVSNTATREKLGVDPYLEMAAEYGYQVQQIVCFANFGSIHNVPNETMDKFREQLRSSLTNELKDKHLP